MNDPEVCETCRHQIHFSLCRRCKDNNQYEVATAKDMREIERGQEWEWPKGVE